MSVQLSILFDQLKFREMFLFMARPEDPSQTKQDE
jgi:hypothetical protein